MYLAPGHAYIFFNYGNHFMLNVSSEPEGTAGGILIRAVEPLEGIALMQHHRKTKNLLDLTRGPGRLAAALCIDRRHDGIDLCASDELWLGTFIEAKARVVSMLAGADSPSSQTAAADKMNPQIGVTTRIGITRAADRLLRFYELGNPFVSGPKRLLASLV
jgi:DNA-3-methyladenine glycosylase